VVVVDRGRVVVVVGGGAVVVVVGGGAVVVVVGGGVVVVVVARASAMAWIWADVRKLSEDIALKFLMADWICVAVDPFFELEASAPWQLAQYCV
jgi:hypothetical protein